MPAIPGVFEELIQVDVVLVPSVVDVLQLPVVADVVDAVQVVV